ncbi:hypothetical protein LN893_02035 [Pontibacter sp. XAAS-A31]|nr:hypothetical protein [Pontibacter harenae]
MTPTFLNQGCWGKKLFACTAKKLPAFFYDSTMFVRTGAIPKRVQKTLLGENGVQTMDDETHKHRKAMFMSLIT